MPIYEYQCPEGHITEAVSSIKDRKKSIACKACNSEAHFIVSATPFHLNGADLGFPTAADKWAREHEKAGGQHIRG